jgi:kynureninase
MINLSLEHARELDAQDPIGGFREQFIIDDPELIYLDGNSLGRLTRASMERVKLALEAEWGRDLINSWNKSWWDAPGRVGEKIAGLLGAGPGQVLVSDQTSINLFKLASAALDLRPGRKRIVTDTFNFPSDLYILQGLVRLLRNRHAILRIGALEDGIAPDLAALEAAIDEDTALVTLSHVTFKSGYLYDMAGLTELAHRRGALVLWDLSHSAGVVPIELDRWDVDFAIGCTYKYLNGGPGAPAFLYVNRRLQEQVESPIWGWWGQAQPFEFGLEYAPADGAWRFLTGTAPILSLLAMEAALDPLLEAGVGRVRAKSAGLTQFAVDLSDSLLGPYGFTLGSPRDPDRRGSHVSIRHPEGYRISRALIEELNVIPDFRAPDSIRLGLAPLYVSYVEVWEAIQRLKRVIDEQRYLHFPQQRLTVT